jgi:hypothetical protein
MKINKLIITSILLASIAPSASASIINELEANGTATNNTLATAQAIAGANFTPNASPNVFGMLPTASIQGVGGNGDVDFFSFFTQAGSAYFSINNVTSSFDSALSLFNSSGTLIAFGDDSVPPQPGSTSTKDAFLGSINLAAGTYFIAVSEAANLPNSLATGINFSDLFRPDNAIGGTAITGTTPGDSTFFTNGTQGNQSYVLNISAAGAGPAGSVPEPGSLFLLSIGALALSLTKKRSVSNLKSNINAV